MRPESPELLGFVNGVLAMGFVVAAAFFLKFWRRTGDGLFAAFAVAFILLGLGQPLPTLLHTEEAASALLYLVRLTAFMVIIWAVLRKNRRP